MSFEDQMRVAYYLRVGTEHQSPVTAVRLREAPLLPVRQPVEHYYFAVERTAHHNFQRCAD